MPVGDQEILELLMDRDGPGVFTRALGFGTGTGVIKGVHVMNDFAQTGLGGRPEDEGDLLAAVIREDKRDGEDNTDEALRRDSRLGARYAAAFPAAPELSSHLRTCIRAAVRDLVNHDGGLYKPGDRMASGLVTHRGLLGAEGFRRFGVGRYLFLSLGPEGQQRVREVYNSATDPYARALAPLSWDGPLVPDSDRAWPDAAPTPFDEALGARLTHLLAHPLAKPHLLRLFLHAATLGLFLKVMGAGHPEGRPTVLATSAEDERPSRLLREEAVQSVRHAVSCLDGRLASVLAAELEALGRARDAERARDLIARAREPSFAGGKIYWPEKFVIALANKAGCILPRSDRAGWGKHLVLTPDLVEALVLMFVPPGAPARPWRAIWADVGAELGLFIGADTHNDALALRAAGVVHVLAEHLEQNQANILALAVRRGVARHLPDGGAEAGGELE